MSWKLDARVVALLPCILLLLAACGSNANGQQIEAIAGGGSIWVLSRVDRSLTVIDPLQAAATRRINLGFQSDPGTLVYWDGSVWVGSSGGTLQRVDAASRTLADTFSVPFDIWNLSAAGHGVYAMDAELGLVSRHDPQTGALLATLDPPDRIHAMAAGPDAVAVLTGDRREIHFYAPGATQSRVVEAELGGGDMVLGFGSFWIYHPDGRLLRADPDSGGIQAEIALEPDWWFPGLAVGEDAVWLAVPDTQEVIRVDPATNGVTHRFGVNGVPEHLAVHGDAVWVALTEDDAVIRLDPATGNETARLEVEYPLRIVAVP